MKEFTNNSELVINPRDYRTDNLGTILLVIFWVIWAPATVLITVRAITEPNLFLFFWLIFGFLGTFGVPFELLSRYRKQILRVVGDLLVVKETGALIKSTVSIPKDKLHALTLERFSSGRLKEAGYTINLFQKSGFRPTRITVADNVHPKDQRILFEKIKEFLLSHSFSFEIKNEMTATDSSKRLASLGGSSPEIEDIPRR